MKFGRQPGTRGVTVSEVTPDLSGYGASFFVAVARFDGFDGLRCRTVRTELNRA